MKSLCALSLALGISGLLVPPASGQTVYRCGNSYSQTPCPGGNALDASDSRDKAQKAQTDAAVRRDLKTADALEKNRIKQEKEIVRSRSPRPYSDPAGYDIPLAEASTDHGYDGTRKNRKPEHFTARATTEPHPKKKTDASTHTAPGKGKSGDARP